MISELINNQKGGYKIMENFNRPFFQKNIALFWRSWHISVYSWIRDYFFFPILATGITEITYSLQVENIKNSYSGQAKLWGMYDDVRVSTQSVTLENIPRKYYINNSIYLKTLININRTSTNFTENHPG